MRERLWWALERACCTCWIYAGHERPWRIPFLPFGRDEDGVWRCSLGSLLYSLDSAVAIKAYRVSQNI